MLAASRNRPSGRGLSAAWCGSAVKEKETIELHTSEDDDSLSRLRGKCGTPMVTVVQRRCAGVLPEEALRCG